MQYSNLLTFHIVDLQKYFNGFFCKTLVCWLVDMKKFTSWKFLKPKKSYFVDRVDKPGGLKNKSRFFCNTLVCWRVDIVDMQTFKFWKILKKKSYLVDRVDKTGDFKTQVWIFLQYSSLLTCWHCWHAKIHIFKNVETKKE